MVTIVKVLEKFNPRTALGDRQWVAFTEVMLRRGQAVAVVQLDEEEPELLTEDPDHGE